MTPKITADDFIFYLIQLSGWTSSTAVLYFMLTLDTGGVLLAAVFGAFLGATAAASGYAHNKNVFQSRNKNSDKGPESVEFVLTDKDEFTMRGITEKSMECDTK